MAKSIEETLTESFSDPVSAAAQSDLAQAAALARQELSFRQRAGAAAAQLRQAKADGADLQEIAVLEAEFNKRTARLEAAGIQFRAADVKRPAPDKALAQVFGRADGKVEKPPLTAAALSQEGEILAQAAAAANGAFHLTHEGDLDTVTLQLSDGEGRVLYRSKEAVTIPAGAVEYVDVSLEPPKPEPGPVPTNPKMPDLIGQTEGSAVALLCRIGISETKIVDTVAEGQPDIVIKQAPEAGTVLANDAVPVLTVRRAPSGTQDPTFLPGFIGSHISEAEAKLKELGLATSITRKVDDGEPNIVLGQFPAEGTPLKDVSTVALSVSRKQDSQSETVTVPDLVGKSRDVSVEILSATGLEAKVKLTIDAEAGEGVTAQKPAAGRIVTRGSAVTITVNTPPGSGAGRVAVPNVIGRKVDEAKRVLELLELQMEVQSKADEAPEGQVIDQAPKATARIKAGSTVLVTVSQGSGRRRRGSGDLAGLVREMARDPRSDDSGLTVERIETMLQSVDVVSLDDARALAETPVKAVRDRMKLSSQAAASRFRAILRKALRTLG